MNKLPLVERGRLRDAERAARNKRRREANVKKKQASVIPEFMPADNNVRQMRFVRALAIYLVENQVRNSIALQLQNPWAIEWATVRNASSLFGYLTVDEAEKELTNFLKGL